MTWTDTYVWCLFFSFKFELLVYWQNKEWTLRNTPIILFLWLKSLLVSHCSWASSSDSLAQLPRPYLIWALFSLIAYGIHIHTLLGLVVFQFLTFTVLSLPLVTSCIFLHLSGIPLLSSSSGKLLFTLGVAFPLIHHQLYECLLCVRHHIKGLILQNQTQCAKSLPSCNLHSSPEPNNIQQIILLKDLMMCFLSRNLSGTYFPLLASATYFYKTLYFSYPSG